MSDALKGIQPEKLWELFAQIARIPHGSKNEAQLAAHLRQVAEKAGFIATQDDAGNLCVSVPATPGYESAPVVVLQGHLDMVCEKNEAVDKNPVRPPTYSLNKDWAQSSITGIFPATEAIESMSAGCPNM